MNDCNLLWFAEIFKEMLLYYGTNFVIVGSNMSESKSIFNSDCPNNNLKRKNLDLSFKQRHLEARIGKGASTSNSPNSRAQGSENQKLLRLKWMFVSLQDPSTHFIGDEQFFFRFLLIMDSYRFNSRLTDCIISEIFRLCSDQNHTPHVSSKNQISSPTYESDNKMPLKETTSSGFLIRVSKLRLLGKFLGLLTFSPYWTTSTSGLNDGPLVALLTKATLNKESGLFRHDSVSLFQIIQNSYTEKNLSYTIPWITSFLRMMFWDKSLVEILLKTNCAGLASRNSSKMSISSYLSVFGLLGAIQNSSCFQIQADRLITRNR